MNSFIMHVSFCSVFLFHGNRAIKRSNCFHASHDKDPCEISSIPYMIIFGVTEIIFSQIPDFDQIGWLSVVAAVMSFTYSSVGLGLGIGQVAGTILLVTKSMLIFEKKYICETHLWLHS
ncbi:hypothetical protein Droror1_Dr00005122 [Drosera rotundifolia]